MAAGTKIAETNPTTNAEIAGLNAQRSHRRIGKIIMIAGSADPTTGYVAAGTSNYADLRGYSGFAIAARLVSGTAPTSVEVTALFTDSMDATPADFPSVNDSTVGGTTTLTACEVSLTCAANNAFVTRPIPACGRFLKIKIKRTGGAADTRIEVAIWPITHIS